MQQHVNALWPVLLRLGSVTVGQDMRFSRRYWQMTGTANPHCSSYTYRFARSSPMSMLPPISISTFTACSPLMRP